MNLPPPIESAVTKVGNIRVATRLIPDVPCKDCGETIDKQRCLWTWDNYKRYPTHCRNCKVKKEMERSYATQYSVTSAETYAEAGPGWAGHEHTSSYSEQ